MFIWGFGPIFKAIIALLKQRIKAAEALHAAKVKAIKEETDAKIEMLQTAAREEEEAHVQEQVKALFREVV